VARAQETPFVTAHAAADFLVTLAEPTRLRIVNCLGAAPLFVSDLVGILALPQPTISRHLRVLRQLGVVRDTALPPYVVYRLDPLGPHRRLLRAILDALRDGPGARAERSSALRVSRAELAGRLVDSAADAADAP
jgi:ArsR family transcriptional regulator